MCLDLVLRTLSVILVSFFSLLLLFCFVAAADFVVILLVICFVVAVASVVVDGVAGVIDIICFF